MVSKIKSLTTSINYNWYSVILFQNIADPPGPSSSPDTNLPGPSMSSSPDTPSRQIPDPSSPRQPKRHRGMWYNIITVEPPISPSPNTANLGTVYWLILKQNFSGTDKSWSFITTPETERASIPVIGTLISTNFNCNQQHLLLFLLLFLLQFLCPQA